MSDEAKSRAAVETLERAGWTFRDVLYAPHPVWVPPLGPRPVFLDALVGCEAERDELRAEVELLRKQLAYAELRFN